MRFGSLLLVVVLGAVLFGDALASPAFAAAGGEKPGIFGPEIPLGIWTLVVFGLLLFILRKYAWGPMLDTLHKREEAIRAAVEEAKTARAETARVRAEFQAEMARAYEQIPKMMDEARRDAENLRQEMVAKATAEIQTERLRLRREVDLARDQALKEITDRAGQLATLISAKVIRRALGPDDHRRLVDEALDELRNTGEEHQREVEGLQP